MTNNTEVLKTATPLLPLFVMNAWFELMRMGLIRAIIKALNMNEKTLILSLVS